MGLVETYPLCDADMCQLGPVIIESKPPGSSAALQCMMQAGYKKIIGVQWNEHLSTIPSERVICGDQRGERKVTRV